METKNAWPGLDMLEPRINLKATNTPYVEGAIERVALHYMAEAPAFLELGMSSWSSTVRYGSGAPHCSPAARKRAKQFDMICIPVDLRGARAFEGHPQPLGGGLSDFARNVLECGVCSVHVSGVGRARRGKPEGGGRGGVSPLGLRP